MCQITFCVVVKFGCRTIKYMDGCIKTLLHVSAENKYLYFQLSFLFLFELLTVLTFL